MLTGNVRPTTLEGIKSLASQIRRQQGVKHAVALDEAARAANFQNYRGALRLLTKNGGSGPQHYVLLTMYWSDRESGYRAGRETLRVELSKPLFEICEKSSLKRVRGFGNLRMVAADHLVCDSVASSQASARDDLLTAERSLRFMEHTGLRKGKRGQKPYSSKTGELPGADHYTEWVDPVNGQLILIDEPYSTAADDTERSAWAARNGWLLVKSTWPGMYYPYQCDLFVATRAGSGYDLDNLLAKIDGIPLPTRQEDWDGDSALSWETYVSPMATTPQDIRRARCRGTIYPASSATSLPYDFRMGTSRRRPKGSLGIPGHVEAGRIIKAIIQSRQRPWGVYTRLNSLRSELENWMNIEIGPGGLPGPEFFDVYYRQTKGDQARETQAQTKAGVIEMLVELKTMLQAAYSASAPLRHEVRRVEMSISLVEKMKAKGI